ncbi:MAG: UDP-forming alpha,alpha-trehalose-phosphate synthase, partial [Acidobacteria bacterium]|nr:UDP-forming alpha,alpha-trehalose-phosphate synthase [Acidobacteriota bacterium]
QFYWGFCNKTIWPLFHYFPSYTSYEEEFWQTYQRVNQKFCDALLEFLKPQDVVWVQDYHLMLLPRMLREKAPQVPVGFFLHIPFPSFEIFRLLPPRWRRDLLEGLLGADLVGFHTYEYTQHFLQSVLRILGQEHQMGYVTLPDHISKIETYPMGIDFKKFFETSIAPETQLEREKLKQSLAGFRTVLSIDRLDYSKGILNRLEGFELLLEMHPEYRGKLVLILVVVPSRIGVLHYEMMKRQIEELVGRINGKFGSIGWTPVIYQYRHLSLYPLSALYGMSEVAMVTPLRDGMNLIAKEYVSSRTDRTGVLILSEMAGAAKELGEAIIVNPNDRRELANALKEALEMPREEQERRNAIMQERLRRYDVVRWATDFVSQLGQMRGIQEQYGEKPPVMKHIAERYSQAGKRLLLIDYDSALLPAERRPHLTAPPETSLNLLQRLAADHRNSVVLISGAQKPALEQWFRNLPVGMIAENGMWVREHEAEWQAAGSQNKSWKESLLNVLLQYADRIPGSFVEEKEHSITLQYWAADPDQSRNLASELMDNLVHFTANIDVQISQGYKVLEIRNAGVNKGRAANRWLSNPEYSFILAVGDDWTNDDLFRSLPPGAYCLRVGSARQRGRSDFRNSDEVSTFLRHLPNFNCGVRHPNSKNIFSIRVPDPAVEIPQKLGILTVRLQIPGQISKSQSGKRFFRRLSCFGIPTHFREIPIPQGCKINLGSGCNPLGQFKQIRSQTFARIE